MTNIVKSYVTLISIANVDKNFAESFPESLKKNAQEINKEGGLTLKEDNNTNSKLWKRLSSWLKKKKEKKTYEMDQDFS